MDILVRWYQAQTKPHRVSFKTMLVASLLAKGNIFMAQAIGAALAAAALFLGDDGAGALQKFLGWQLFVVALCAVFARSHRYFSFVELEQGFQSLIDRGILAGLNFLLVWQWAYTFLHPSFGLLVSFGSGLFSFFLFSPKNDKDEAERSQIPAE